VFARRTRDFGWIAFALIAIASSSIRAEVPCDSLLRTFDSIAPDAGPIAFRSEEGVGGVSVSATFSIAETTPVPRGIGCPSGETQGFSMGVSHDALILLVVAVETTGAVEALNGNSGPAFVVPQIQPDGWTIGVVYSLAPPMETIVYSPEGDPVVSVYYEGVPDALAGVVGAWTTPLTWDSGLGSPAVANVVVIDGASVAAGFQHGSVTLYGHPEPRFIRGDTNGDAVIDISDVVWLLSELFLGGPSIDCPIASEANADGLVDVADAVHIASYIFLGGPQPASPSPNCGSLPDLPLEGCPGGGGCL
jgi:hypothetical protein